MNHPAVNQLEFLSERFRDVLAKHAPPEILVIGCGTGNGLEYIDPKVTSRVTVIDINEQFLKTLAQRYHRKIPGLEVMHNDLHRVEIQPEAYTLVYAGLVFEFVDPKIVLKTLSQCLRQNGKLEVVLQIPSEDLPTVSSTNIESMKRLKSIVQLVDIHEFCQLCSDSGMNMVGSCVVTLDSGKSFFRGSFQKSAV